jgi:hypothetical protein
LREVGEGGLNPKNSRACVGDRNAEQRAGTG